MHINKQTKLLGLVAFGVSVLGSAQASLVARYQFEETSGTTFADSVGSADGGVVGSGDLDVTGIIGSAYQPGPAGTAYGQVSGGVTNTGITGNSSRTISFWFNTTSFGNGTNQQNRLLGIGSGAAASFDIVAENGSNAGGVNRVGLRYGNGNVYVDANNSGMAFAVDTWYHIAVVYDGTTLDLETIGNASDGEGLVFYVNGVEANSAGGNLNNGTQALNTAASDLFFGSAPTGTNALFPGLLDDVQIYDSALTASEVSTLFSSPGSVIPEPSSLLLVGLGGFLLARRRR